MSPEAQEKLRWVLVTVDNGKKNVYYERDL